MNTLSERVNEVLGEDAYHATFQQVLDRVRKLDDHRRASLLAQCRTAFEKPSCLQDEVARVSWAKIIVAMLPNSANLLAEVLAAQDDDLDYECHFSLFCHLDEVQWDERLGDHADTVLALVKNYLMRVESDRGNASWMAGDLLGGHWCLDQSLPVLAEIINCGRNTISRLAALHGLKEAIERSACEADRAAIRSAVLAIREHDPNEDVRVDACKILELLTEQQQCLDEGDIKR